MESTLATRQEDLFPAAARAVAAAVVSGTVTPASPHLLVMGSRVIKSFDTEQAAKAYQAEVNLLLVYCNALPLFEEADAVPGNS